MAVTNPTLTGIGAGVAGAGALGGLFGGSKAQAPDISGLLNTINQGAQRQTQIASNLPGQLAPLGANYQAGVTGAENKAVSAGNASAQNFLTQLGNNQTLAGTDLTKLLTSQAYANVPQQENAAREAAAATGGLQRGAASELLAQPSLQAAQNVYQGQQQLNLQNQAQKAAALDKINTMDNNQIQTILGIDKDTATALYASGRQDLIDEANQLLGISQTQTNETLGAEQFGISGNIAANAANNAATQGTYQGLTNLGGTLIGLGVGGPAGAAVGGQVANAAAPASTNPALGITGGPGTQNNPLLTSILGGGQQPPPGYTFDPYGNLVPING